MKQFGRKHGGIRNYFETWQSVPQSLCWKGRKDNQINVHHIKIKLIIYREEFDSILHTPPITTTVAMGFPSQLASLILSSRLWFQKKKKHSTTLLPSYHYRCREKLMVVAFRCPRGKKDNGIVSFLFT